MGTWNRRRVLNMAAQSLVIRAWVGFVYPAYKSLHAIMSDDREASLTWMRYWVVLAVFSMIETIVDPLLDFLPGYLLGKCIFLVWHGSFQQKWLKFSFHTDHIPHVQETS